MTPFFPLITLTSFFHGTFFLILNFILLVPTCPYSISSVNYSNQLARTL